MWAFFKYLVRMKSIEFRNCSKTIGVVEVAHPFTLAALSGYSDLGMRTVCRALGACLTRHEVVLDKFILESGNGARGGRVLDPADRPIVCQLMGHEPRMMAEAAARMVPLGYDMIDLNFGCPVKKVLGRRRGGYLLETPATAIEMIARTLDAVTVPVTVKMRRGSDDSPAARDRFWEILERAVELGIAAVTVHGRTVAQRYDGASRWSVLTEVKRRYPDLYVYGSGDLFTAEDCLRMLEETGIDGVTIARGAIHNPWIFRECLALWRGEPKPAPPTLAEQRDLLEWQYRLSLEQYGVNRGTRQMRKFAIKRASLHPYPAHVHASFVDLGSPEHFRELLARFYDEPLSPFEPLDPTAHQPRMPILTCDSSECAAGEE